MLKKIIVVITTAAALAACGGNEKGNAGTEAGKTNEAAMQAEKNAPAKDFSGVTLDAGKDLVCGMPVKVSSIEDTAAYNGKVYGFCSEECKAEFVKNPATYLAQK